MAFEESLSGRNPLPLPRVAAQFFRKQGRTPVRPSEGHWSRRKCGGASAGEGPLPAEAGKTFKRGLWKLEEIILSG